MQAFTSAENALANINDVSEGALSPDLKTFLERSLPASRKVRRAANARPESGHARPARGRPRARRRAALRHDLSRALALLPPPLQSSTKTPTWSLGVADPRLGSAIQEGCGIPCHVSDTCVRRRAPPQLPRHAAPRRRRPLLSFFSRCPPQRVRAAARRAAAH